MKKYFLIIVILSLVSASVTAQEPADSTQTLIQYKPGVKYLVKTRQGQIYKGFIVSETEISMVISQTPSTEKKEILKSDIELCVPVTGDVSYQDVLFGDNPHHRNYLISSSAFLLEASQLTGTYHWFIIEHMEYAINENFAVTTNGIAFYPFSLGVKTAWEINETNHIGGNIGAFANLYADHSSPFIGMNGIVRFTRGTPNNNFTVSGGILAINSEIFSNTSPSYLVNIPVTGFAWCNRLSRRVALNIEGWYLNELRTGLAGGGIKLMEHEGSCWSLGCFALFGKNILGWNFGRDILPIPYIGLTRNFRQP